jgi:hypothetical protein
MTTEVIIEVLDYGGGGTPPESDPAGEGLYLPGAYEATPFFAIIEFSLQETVIDPITLDEVVTITTASSVTSDFDFNSYGITYTDINDSTIRLDGPILNVFPDQFYRFVLPDLSTPVLPFNTEEEFLSLIEYQKPSANSTLFQYTFLIDEVYPATVNQWINWTYDSAVGNIESLILRGLN